ncbi:hypothetical protein [Streptomyces sp. NPDC049879]|uniref:hypothetical protein n=1 Tax=Streptomyces sp. NPDC049879 TaxID=3365598 RepID=UPI003799810C
MTPEKNDDEPDPRAILAAWLSGTYRRFNGQLVQGKTWDDDTRYRYELALAAWPTATRPDQSWFAYIGDLVWHFEPLHLSDWASRIVNQDGSEMSEAARGRAVSAVRSFYKHCEDDLGASRWNLPARRKLVGSVKGTSRPPLTPWQMDALRTAADRYRGPMPERARLATYMTLAGLRPGQSIAVWVNHIARDNQDGPTWRLPAKNNAASAVAAAAKIPRPVVWALDEYLPVRTHRGPDSYEDRGPLLVSRLGRGLDRMTFPKLIRAVAASHPDLEEIAPGLLPDTVAHSPSPFALDEDGPTGG